MNVAQLIERLAALPAETVVLIDTGEGLSLVGAVECLDAQGPGQPPEVLLAPSYEE